ncbi:MAG: M20/M25/M40 family metallo-hydrolase [Patescibacteria group bacterium]
MDTKKTIAFLQEFWSRVILPRLQQFIEIPSLSQEFDKDWIKTGAIFKALMLMFDFATYLGPRGVKCRLIQSDKRTPILYIEIPGQTDKTVLLYGHADKQPESEGWSEEKGLGPWTPKILNDDGVQKLYGRGGVDDGYSLFTAIAAIRALEEQNIPHARCVILIEAGEESGSPDLPAYLEELKGEIGDVSLIVALDSGAGSYDRLWLTNSLRGIAMGTLKVRVLNKESHSGHAGGIVPSSFRIARALLERIEDAQTGNFLLQEIRDDDLITDERKKAVEEAASAMDPDCFRKEFTWSGNTFPDDCNEPPELLWKQTLGPALEVIGANGIPPTNGAGNVVRECTDLKLSFRIPPHVDPQVAIKAIEEALTRDVPDSATVSFEDTLAMPGWMAPELSLWLAGSLERASQEHFGNPFVQYGIGGAIPFMALLGKMYPKAEFVITGAAGPESNAHGPDECLNIPYAIRLTAAISMVLADHATHHTALESPHSV